MPFHGFFLIGFLKSFSVNFITELGDNTFILAVILSTKKHPVPLFIGSLLALSIVDIISSLIGQLSEYIPQKIYLNYVIAILFLFFGIKMAFEAYSMSDDQTSKEYEEIDDKITKFHKESAQSPTTSPRFSFPSSITKRFSLNNGKNKLNNTTSDDVSNSILKDAIIDSESTKNGIYNRILGKNAKFWRTICEAFALNFMAEMGDRSQITIISLSANQNFFGVCCGAIFAHIICLVLALTIGIYAIKYLSLKTVNYIGSGIFVSLAMLTLFSNREAIINLLF